jgi:hypothetical protein
MQRTRMKHLDRQDSIKLAGGLISEGIELEGLNLNSGCDRYHQRGCENADNEGY